MKRLVSLLILICLTSFVYAGGPGQGAAVHTLVIDPGHGGMDPGAIGPGGHHESDLALGVSLKFGEMVKEAFPDVKIIYTRTTDKFVSLADRADMANKAKADLFICIHLNSATNHDAYGTSTYVLGLHRTDDNLEIAKRENAVIDLESNKDKKYDFDPNSPEGHIIMSMKQNAFLDQSILIASKIEDELAVLSKRKSRGVKQAGFWVLYKTAMPSLLAEIGFISNPTEEQYLATDNGQSNIATSIFKAFRSYKNEIEGRKDTDIVIVKASEPEKKKEGLSSSQQQNPSTSQQNPAKQAQDAEVPKQTEPKSQPAPTTDLNLQQAKKEEKAWEPDTSFVPTPHEKAPPPDSKAVVEKDTIKVRTANPEVTKKIVPLRTGNEPTVTAKKDETKTVKPAAADTVKKKTTTTTTTTVKTTETKTTLTAAQKARADSVKAAALKAERVAAWRARTDSIKAATAAATETKAQRAQAKLDSIKAATANAAEARARRAKEKQDSIKTAAAKILQARADRAAAQKAKADSIKTATAKAAAKKGTTTAKATTAENTAPLSLSASDRVVFTVQLLAAHKAPKNYDELVNTFGLINREDIDDGVVRYMAGQFTHYKEALKTLELAKEKGFPTAFIICYVNDVRQDVKRSREIGLKYP